MPSAQPSRLSGQSNTRRMIRRGATAIEMALVLSLFIVILFGIIEVGRLVMVNQVITNASREGARRAVIPGATQTQIENRVTSYLTSAGISGETITIKVNGTAVPDGSSFQSVAKSHDLVSVQVSVGYANVSWGTNLLISSDRTLTSEVVMRKE